MKGRKKLIAIDAVLIGKITETQLILVIRKHIEIK